MVNVLIADDNIHYAINLMNIINKRNENIRVCNITQDGEQTLEILNDDNNIDVILLDYKLPIYNGIQVLERLDNKSKYENSFIIISGEISYINSLDTYNIVHSVISKTTDSEQIIRRINELVDFKESKKNSRKLKKEIIQELLYLGYDISHKGTKYLIKSIEYIASNPDKDLDNLEKSVYSKLSKIYNDSVHNIKCNINRATTAMYYECKIERLKDYFKFDNDAKPKVKTVINTIINKIL